MIGFFPRNNLVSKDTSKNYGQLTWKNVLDPQLPNMLVRFFYCVLVYLSYITLSMRCTLCPYVFHVTLTSSPPLLKWVVYSFPICLCKYKGYPEFLTHLQVSVLLLWTCLLRRTHFSSSHRDVRISCHSSYLTDPFPIPGP